MEFACLLMHWSGLFFNRGTYSESRRAFKLRDSPDPMQTDPSPQGGNGLSLTLQPELLARMPGAGSASRLETDEEVRVTIGSGRGATSRRPRAASHSHSHSQGHTHSHEHESDSSESDLESGESSSSLSELRYLLRWLKKSLPFIVILCAKLVVQHALGTCRWEQLFMQRLWCVKVMTPVTRLCCCFSVGLAVAVGLFTTFMYVNKSIQTQVFLHVSLPYYLIFNTGVQCLLLLLYGYNLLWWSVNFDDCALEQICFMCKTLFTSRAI